MSKAIYKALWASVMFTDSICHSVRVLISYFHMLFVIFCSSLTLHRHKNDIQYLEKCKSTFKKIPKHLNIVIGTEKVSSDILSRIAFYALILDIDYISYYDVNGSFSLDQSDIPKCINSQRMQNGRLLWSMSADRKTSGLLKYKNGLEKSIEVVVLSKDDGKPLLANICKDLCQTRNNPDIREALKDRNTLAKQINVILQKRLDNLPDPELAVIFDRTLCTFGLLPWHTGFTEFDYVDNSDCFNVETFVNILYKFSKCEQRFGH